MYNIDPGLFVDVKSDLRKYYECVNSDKVVSQHRSFKTKLVTLRQHWSRVRRKVCLMNNSDFALRDHSVEIQRTEDSRKIKR